MWYTPEMPEFVCPTCSEVHQLPKAGPYKECCFKAVFEDAVGGKVEGPFPLEGEDPADWWKK